MATDEHKIGGRKTHLSTGYVSEFEQFLKQFKAAHPEVDEDQQHGLSIWWNKGVETGNQDVRHKDTIPVKGYKYS